MVIMLTVIAIYTGWGVDVLYQILEELKKGR